MAMMRSTLAGVAHAVGVETTQVGVTRTGVEGAMTADRRWIQEPHFSQATFLSTSEAGGPLVTEIDTMT